MNKVIAYQKKPRVERSSPELNCFDGIGLDEMEDASLMSRTETKFVSKEDRVLDIIEKLSEYYHILEIDEKRLFTYKNVYFDTSDKSLFRSHITGRKTRTKIRSRQYVDSSLCFLEVKKRHIKGTEKLRIAIDNPAEKVESETADFIWSHSSVIPSNLEAVLWNKYQRLTLVSKDHKERVTVDIGLRCTNKEGFYAVWPRMAIVEVKQGRKDRNTPIMRAFRDSRILERSVSKYCIGIIALNPQIRHNRYKRRLLSINKAMNTQYGRD